MSSTGKDRFRSHERQEWIFFSQTLDHCRYLEYAARPSIEAWLHHFTMRFMHIMHIMSQLTDAKKLRIRWLHTRPSGEKSSGSHDCISETPFPWYQYYNGNERLAYLSFDLSSEQLEVDLVVEWEEKFLLENLLTEIGVLLIVLKGELSFKVALSGKGNRSCPQSVEA